MAIFTRFGVEVKITARSVDGLMVFVEGVDASKVWTAWRGIDELKADGGSLEITQATQAAPVGARISRNGKDAVRMNTEKSPAEKAEAFQRAHCSRLDQEEIKAMVFQFVNCYGKDARGNPIDEALYHLPPGIDRKSFYLGSVVGSAPDNLAREDLTLIVAAVANELAILGF